jgi:hypothetical protein
MRMSTRRALLLALMLSTACKPQHETIGRAPERLCMPSEIKPCIKACLAPGTLGEKYFIDLEDQQRILGRMRDMPDDYCKSVN